MALAFLLPLLIAGQDLTSPISYTTIAKPAAKVLKEISEVAKVHLEADPDAAREVLLISVHDVPLKSLLDRIAGVTSCVWKQEGEGYRLAPAEDVREKEQQSETAAAIAAMAKTLGDEAKGLEKQKDAKLDQAAQDAEDEREAMGFAGPLDRKAILHILQAIGPASFASVKAGQRIVFASNNATATQTPMPESCAGIISEWVADHNANVAGAEGDLDDSVPKQIRDMVKRNMSRVSAPVFKAILVVKPEALFNSLQASLSIYDRSGKVLLQATDTVSADTLADIAQKSMSAAKAKPPTHTGTPIEFSPDSQQIRALFSQPKSGMDALFWKISPELKKKLFSPNDQDPLSFMASDIYLSVARHENRQLVADLPDDTFDVGTGAPATIEEAEKDMKTGDSVRGSDDGQFLTIRPTNPTESRRTRLDRPSLAAFLGAMETKEVPSLDDISAFALKNVPYWENAISSSVAFFGLSMILTDSHLLGTDWNTYRLYGSLSPTERSTLESGGSIPFSSLNAAQQGYLAAIAFGANAHPFSDAGTKISTDILTVGLAMAGMSVAQDFHEEPTEVMPSGLPPDGFLTAKVRTVPIFKPEMSDGSSSYSIANPELLGLYQAVKRNPGLSSMAASLSLPSSGKVGQETQMELKLHLAKGVSMGQHLVDVLVPKGGPKRSLDDLPSEFKALIAAEADTFRKSPFAVMAAMSGMQGSTTPP